MRAPCSLQDHFGRPARGRAGTAAAVTSIGYQSAIIKVGAGRRFMKLSDRGDSAGRDGGAMGAMRRRAGGAHGDMESQAVVRAAVTVIYSPGSCNAFTIARIAKRAPAVTMAARP